jgi:hypothetical protein
MFINFKYIFPAIIENADMIDHMGESVFALHLFFILIL